jgi:hypothetical protein
MPQQSYLAGNTNNLARTVVLPERDIATSLYPLGDPVQPQIALHEISTEPTPSALFKPGSEAQPDYRPNFVLNAPLSDQPLMPLNIFSG